ncbi:MAG: hypothetical protein QNJ81_00865 [Acidimicrobiia bacterium]|nr:hypothetical protein [Acidimicrobiia bacterium]
MGRSIELWLDDEAEEALAVLCSAGATETEAVRTAVIEAAAHANIHPLVSNPEALERALDKSHDVIAEIQTTHRPPR